jgi:hypothetical protein
MTAAEGLARLYFGAIAQLGISIAVVYIFVRIGQVDKETGPVAGFVVGVIVMFGLNVFWPGGYFLEILGHTMIGLAGGVVLLTCYKLVRDYAKEKWL